MKLFGLESLSKDVFERRTPTGSVFFALFGGRFARNFEKIVCIKVREPSKTNLVTSRHIKKEKASLLDVMQRERCVTSKKRLRGRLHFLLMWAAQKRHCLSSLFFGECGKKITFNLFLVLESKSLFGETLLRVILWRFSSDK